MSKSKCCGADVSEEDFCMRKCCKCKNFCDYADLAPALRDSKEVLEFVEKEIEELNKYPLSYTRKCLLIQANKIKNFIEGKE